MGSSNFTTIRIRQNGQLLQAYAGCRFHRGGTVSGVVGSVLCFEDVVIGDRRDPRCGRTLTPRDFGGSVTIEVLDGNGNLITRIGLATAADVRRHPNCKTTKYGQ